jgi:hypothetical protein
VSANETCQVTHHYRVDGSRIYDERWTCGTHAPGRDLLCPAEVEALKAELRTVHTLLANRPAEFTALVAAAREVMDMLEEHGRDERGPSIVPHLLDSDQNAGQRLRDLLASLV